MNSGKKKKLVLLGVLAGALLAGGIVSAVWWFSPEPLLQLDPAEVTEFTLQDGNRGRSAALEGREAAEAAGSLFSGVALRREEWIFPVGSGGYAYWCKLWTEDGTCQSFIVNPDGTVSTRGFVWKPEGTEIDLEKLRALIPREDS